MADTKGPTFVLSINDLEAAMIYALVQGADNEGKALGQVLDIKKPWGRTETASLDAAVFARLANTVVLVEVNSPQIQEQLRNAGKEVVIIDHHLYQTQGAGPLNLRSGFSSLEQVIKYTGHRPGDRVAALPAYLDVSLSDGRTCSFANLVKLISANDRGHIPLLADEAMDILGISACEYKAPCVRHDNKLWDVKQTCLTEIGQGWKALPATWDQNEQKPAAWQVMEELVRDIRLRETTLGHWLLTGNPIEELANPETFKHQYMITADLLGQAINYIARAEDKNKVRLFATGRDEKTDPALYLIQAPIKYRKVLFDALYFWRAGQGHALNERLSALIVFHEDDDENTLRLLEFYGDDNYSQAVSQWFEPNIRQLWGTKRLEFWAGGGPGCFFGAEDRLRTEGQALSKLADCILDTVLTGNRSVERWRTSFLQPLRFKKEGLKIEALGQLKKVAAEEPSRLIPVVVGPEEQHYFMPHTERTLAPSSLEDRLSIGSLLEEARRGESLASFERIFDDLCLQLVLPNHPKPYVLNLSRVRLHFFYHSVMVLEWVPSDEKTSKEDEHAGIPDHEWENKSNEPKDSPPPPPYWKSLLTRKEPCDFSLAQILDINNKLSECYSTYSVGGTRGGPGHDQAGGKRPNIGLVTAWRRGAQKPHYQLVREPAGQVPGP